MAEKDGIIVIRKKKRGAAHGGHGGAWKVAYADFVTSMMMFFLVMWLLGSDAATKQAISHYFNHPNTPWKAGGDKKSKVVNPMGEKPGEGDSVLTGALGLYPADLVPMPRPARDLMKDNVTISRLIEDILQGKVYGMDVTQHHVRFSLPEKVLFAPGSARLEARSVKSLHLLGELLKNFSGYIVIEGHTDNSQPDPRGAFKSNWQLSMARALAVMNYFKTVSGIRASKMYPVGSGPRRAIASNATVKGREKNRRVEFTLTYDKPKF